MISNLAADGKIGWEPYSDALQREVGLELNKCHGLWQKYRQEAATLQIVDD